MKKTLTLAIAAALVAAACGTAVDDLPTDLGGDGIRVVAVTMSEFYFSPAVVEVEQGETVRFVVTNDGVAEHEFELSNDAAIAASVLAASCASASANAEPATMDPNTTASQGITVVEFVREQAPEAAAATLGSDEEIYAHLQRIIAAARIAIAQDGACQSGFNSYLKGALSRETELDPAETYNRSTTFFFAAYLATDAETPERDWLFSCFDANRDGKQDRMPGLNPGALTHQGPEASVTPSAGRAG